MRACLTAALLISLGSYAEPEAMSGEALRIYEKNCRKLEGETLTNTTNITQATLLKRFCENPNSIIPDSKNDVVLQTQYYLTGITGLTVCVLGCVGNALATAILRKKIYSSSTNTYLLALAVSDTCLLIFAGYFSLYDIVRSSASISLSVENFHSYMFSFVNASVNLFQTTSIWLVVAFTVDRYVMICHPFKGIQFCNRKNAIIQVLSLCLAGTLYNLPKYFEYQTTVQFLAEKKYVLRNRREFADSRFYSTFVDFWTYLIFVFALPWIILSALNFRLIATVKQSKTTGKRLSLGKTCNHRNDTTLMLVAVVTIFLICQMPALIAHTIRTMTFNESSIGEFGYSRMLIFTEVANFLVILNSAMNILLYYGLSPKFRGEFSVQFLRPCLHKSQLIVRALSRQFSHRSSSTVSSALSTKGCPPDETMHGVYAWQESEITKQSETTSQEQSMIKRSFGTLASSDGICLATPCDVERFTISDSSLITLSKKGASKEINV
ncbi:G-protein coupled receptor daf-37-like [Watersipora subatra]|uniref:G-protein coupled receptor daf-37-like n=1 Tax=Watersipora subatra TaxID=2589382 RepID=UPI00355BF946